MSRLFRFVAEHSDILLTALAAIASLVSGIKAVTFIQEKEEALKVRMGSVRRHKKGSRAGRPIIYKKGPVFLIPFVDKVRRQYVGSQTLPLETQTITLKDGVVLTVDAFVTIKIRNVYKALFEVDNVIESVVDRSAGAIGQIVEEMTSDDLLLSSVKGRVTAEIHKRVAEWGVEVVEVQFTNSIPNEASMGIINMKKKVRVLKRTLGDMGMTLEDAPPNVVAALLGAPLITTP